jgi:hypothetical protein
MQTAILVHITEDLIRSRLIAGSCFDCVIAVALQQATGDTEASVVEDDSVYYLVVWGRNMEAPHRVAEFIGAFDSLPRVLDSWCPEGAEAIVPEVLTEALAPFDFELPPLTDSDWKESCHHCWAFVEQADVDDDGVCGECRSKETD